MAGQNVAEELAGELRRMRRLSGKSLKELESLTFVSDSSLSRYLSGRLPPPWAVVAALCRLVRRDPRDLRALWEQVWAVETRAAEEPSGPARRAFLPRDVAGFTGRASEVDLLLDGTSAIDAIDGMAGVGKTALAVHVAHLLSERYPDGQFYIDLHGHTPGRDPVEPTEALRQLLTAVGVASSAIPADVDAAAARWRAELAGRRAILVFDNTATAAQLRPLLPGMDSSHTIVTSRHRLVDLDGARAAPLNVLDRGTATELFRLALATPGGRKFDETAANEVVHLCGYLPLGIRLAAARLRHRPAWTISRLAMLLGDERRRLATLEIGERGVLTAFNLSYRRLREDQSHLFRLLGLAPCDDLDVHAAAALADLPLLRAEETLEELVDAHLVQQHTAGRYRMHDLLRQYAAQTSQETQTAQDRQQAIDRLLDYYLHVTRQATGQLSGQIWHLNVEVARVPSSAPPVATSAEALSWLDAESANLVAVVRHAAAVGRFRHATAVPQLLHSYHQQRGRHAESLDMVEVGLAAARSDGDLAAQARLHHTGAMALALASDRAGAQSALERSLACARQSDDRQAIVVALHNLGYVRSTFGRDDEALPFYEEAVALRRRYGSEAGNAVPMAAFAVVLARLGRCDEADTMAGEALAIARADGDRFTEICCADALAVSARQRGHYPGAVEHLQRKLSLAEETGNLISQANALVTLADLHRRMGNLNAATGLLDHAEDVCQRIGPTPIVALSMPLYWGALHLSCGRPDLAKASYQAALTAAIDARHPAAEARARWGLAAALVDIAPAEHAEQARLARELLAKLRMPEPT